MCKSVARFALAVLLTVGGSNGLLAQGTSGIRVRERAVDSLVATWSKASAALKAYDDSTERTSVALDTLRVGNLSLLVEASVRDRAERAGRIASARLDSTAGTAAKRAGETWLVVRSASNSAQGDTISVAIRWPDSRRTVGTDNRERRTLWGVADDSTLAGWLYRASLTALSTKFTTPMRLWLFNEFSPDTLTTTQWLGTRLDVVSSPATAARRCYNGDVEACKTSMRLVPVGDAIMEWFDADGRRAFVTNLKRHSESRDPDIDLCGEGSDKACIAVMRRSQYYGDPIPPHRHGSVASTAIRMGGPGGYARLLNATGTPAEQLAIAAGVPVDSVLRVWISSVRSARRPSRDVSPGIAFTSIGWMLVCGVLALRSSRWR